jgi:hypothetical protein
MTLSQTYPALASIVDRLSLCSPRRQFLRDFSAAEEEASKAANLTDMALCQHFIMRSKFPALVAALDEIAQ